jgi:hypothetical protein
MKTKWVFIILFSIKCIIWQGIKNTHNRSFQVAGCMLIFIK